jgi:hypothetical protein
VDHLAVDQDAVPTFVEVKRASDTRARREVVAQMLDYAANGSVFWTPGQLRGWFEDQDRKAAMEQLMGLLNQPDGDPETAAEGFWQAVGTNLREGRIRLVFVADEIPASLRRLVEFLNEQMPRVEVLALEIRQYRAGQGRAAAVVPRLVGQTARAQAGKVPAAPVARRPARWTAAEVLDCLNPAGQEAAAAGDAVHSWAAAHPRIRITGGTGNSDRSFTMAADTGSGTSPYLGVLSLYATPRGGRPFLEIRIRAMLATPPNDRGPARERLTADLRALAIPRPQESNEPMSVPTSPSANYPAGGSPDCFPSSTGGSRTSEPTRQNTTSKPRASSGQQCPQGQGPRCQAEGSQAEPIGAAWPATADELAQVSGNGAEELLPAAAGGDHRAGQAFQGQRTGQADQDPAAPGGWLGRVRRVEPAPDARLRCASDRPRPA